MTSLYAEPVHYPKLTHRFIHPFCLQGEPVDKDVTLSCFLQRSVVWNSEFLSKISETVPVSIVTDWHDEGHVSNIQSYWKYAVRWIRDNCVSINETRDRITCYNKPWKRKHVQFPKHWIRIFHMPVRQRRIITESLRFKDFPLEITKECMEFGCSSTHFWRCTRCQWIGSSKPGRLTSRVEAAVRVCRSVSWAQSRFGRFDEL
jgi:hypothetical protein